MGTPLGHLRQRQWAQAVINGALLSLIDASETDAVTCVAPAGFARPSYLDDLSTPQSIVSSDGICKLNPRELCLLQAARILSNKSEWI